VKTSTALILAAAGVVVVYFVTRPKTPALSTALGSKPSSGFGALGQILGGFVLGAGGSVTKTSSPNVVTTSSGGSSGYSGDTEVQIVKSLDSGGISAYDAQGTSDAPVYGIAGIDY